MESALLVLQLEACRYFDRCSSGCGIAVSASKDTTIVGRAKQSSLAGHTGGAHRHPPNQPPTRMLHHIVRQQLLQRFCKRQGTQTTEAQLDMGTHQPHPPPCASDVAARQPYLRPG